MNSLSLVAGTSLARNIPTPVLLSSLDRQESSHDHLTAAPAKINRHVLSGTSQDGTQIRRIMSPDYCTSQRTILPVPTPDK